MINYPKDVGYKCIVCGTWNFHFKECVNNSHKFQHKQIFYLNVIGAYTNIETHIAKFDNYKEAKGWGDWLRSIFIDEFKKVFIYQCSKIIYPNETKEEL